RLHTRFSRDWSSDVCSSDLLSTISGHDPLDPTSLSSVCLEVPSIEPSFKGLTVGVDLEWINKDVDPVIQKALEEIIRIIFAGGEIGRASCRERGEIGCREGC